MRISAAKLTGKEHSRCEDHFAYRRSYGWTVAVLSDGAGSKSAGAAGAKTAVDCVCRSLPLLLDTLPQIDTARAAKEQTDALSSLIIGDIIDAIKQKSGGKKTGEYAATLLFAAYGEKADIWITGHLGDGVIAAVDTGGKETVLSCPHRGEFANQTYFITDPDAPELLRIGIFGGVSGVMLMSDGPAVIFYDRRSQSVSRAVSSLFKWQQAVEDRAMSSILRKNLIRYAAPRTRDDCSVIMMQKRSGDE